MHVVTVRTIGYVRVSTDTQADRAVSLEAQSEKIRGMSVVHDAGLLEIIVDGGESAKSLNRPGMERLLGLVDAGEVQAVIIAKLDRLTRSVTDLYTLLERFTRRGVALVSVAESLDKREQEALSEIKNLRRNNHTLRGIATTLNQRALRTCRGSARRLEHVTPILKRTR